MELDLKKKSRNSKENLSKDRFIPLIRFPNEPNVFKT